MAQAQGSAKDIPAQQPEYQVSSSLTAYPDTGKKQKNANSLLRKCFSGIVDRKQVNLDMSVLNLILRNELTLNLASIQPEELSVIHLMLVWYIKTWPGWQRSTEYFAGQLTFKVWYDKFQKYINLKMNYLINEGLEEAREIRAEVVQHNESEAKKLSERGQQTDNLAPKSYSPYVIEISSDPSLLNKIVFTEVNEDSVLLKCHSEVRWEDLSVQQLLSWPHVEVHLNSPLFKFSRKNVHEYKRQINLANTPVIPETTEFIEDVSIMDSTKSPRTVYGLTFLTHMAKELLNGLEPIAEKLSVDLDVIGQVLTAFLQDIKELNLNDTIASNTSVTFNMGKSVYSRNKKLSRGSTSVVISLNETIIPKMCLEFFEFRGLGYISDSGAISCDYLKLLKSGPKNFTKDMVPTVTFRCNYCDLNFGSVEMICVHLKVAHKMAQQVLCVTCKQCFSIPFLAENRWSHECKLQRYK